MMCTKLSKYRLSDTSYVKNIYEDTVQIYENIIY